MVKEDFIIPSSQSGFDRPTATKTTKTNSDACSSALAGFIFFSERQE